MDAPQKQEGLSKKDRKLHIAAAAVVVAGAIALAWYLAHRGEESTDDAFLDAHVIPISAQVAAHVDRVLVDDNQQVTKGQLLVQLQTQDFEVAVEQSKAEVEAAHAEQVRTAADAKRAEQLFGKDQISRQAYEKAVADANVARARADLADRKLQAADINLSYTKIVAPEDGKITRKSVEPDSYVQVGQPLLALVPKAVWVTANFKETQLTQMRAGQPATIHVDAYPHKKFKAHVDSIQSGTGARFSLLPPENATGNFIKVVQRVPVKIVFDEPLDGYLLAPGMSVEPTVYVK